MGYMLYNAGFFKATKQVNVEEIKKKIPSNNIKFPAELSDVLNNSFEGCTLELSIRVKIGDKVYNTKFVFRNGEPHYHKFFRSLGPTVELLGYRQYGERSPSGDWVYYIVNSLPLHREPILTIYKYCYTPEHSRELKIIRILLGRSRSLLFDLNPISPDYEIVYWIYAYDHYNASNYTEFKELWETGFILDVLRQMPLWNDDNFTENSLIEASALYLMEGEVNYRKVPQKILDFMVTCNREIIQYGILGLIPEEQNIFTLSKGKKCHGASQLILMERKTPIHV